MANPNFAAGQSVPTTVVRGVVVDEAGKPVENSRVAVHPPNGRKVEVAAPNGEFTVEIPRIGNELLLSAQNERGELQGTVLFRGQQTEPIRVTLRKAREVVVTVTDPAKQAIGGARVGIDAGTSLLRQGTVAEGVTDDSGRTVLRYPADASMQAIFAIKRDVGVNYNMLTVGPLEPQTVVLGDNVTFQIRVIDDEDKPLAGVSLQPISLGIANFSLRGCEELHMTTDATGQATVRMIPAANIGRTSFSVELKDYVVIQPIRYDSRVAPKEVTARLAPLVTLRGKVTGADGQPPSSRVEVYASGAGFHPRQPSTSFSIGWAGGDVGSFFRATCNEDGSFELKVARNHYYALLAWSNPQRAPKESIVSPLQMRVVGNNSPTEELAFQLGPGRRVYGLATRGKVNPMINAPVELAWRDTESYGQLPADKRLPNPEHKTADMIPKFSQVMFSDREGAFEFYVPPARYTLSSKMSGGEPKTIDVTKEAEVKVDVDAGGLPPGFGRAAGNVPPQPAAQLIELAGKVVLEADRERGIDHVSVRRIDIGRPGVFAQGASSPIQTTGRDGTFQMTRVGGESLLICSTADGLLSSIVKIPATAKEVTIPLTPTTSVRGRLIDAKTKEPLVGHEIDTMIQTDQSMSTTMAPFAITDSRGEFVLTGLTAGWPIRLCQKTTPRSVSPNDIGATRLTTLKTVTVDKAEVVDLGDVTTSEAQPLSLEQVISYSTRGIYASTGRMEAELGRAELLGQNVLVFAAASESDVGRRFFKLWYGLDKQAVDEAKQCGLADLSKRFVLLALDTSQANRVARTSQSILDRSKLKFPAPDDAGLAILAVDGEVIATSTGKELSSSGQFDAEKLAALLNRHAPPPPNAEELLSDALAKAQRDGKLVFVFQSVPLSSPSALLSIFLDSQKELLAKDYVCVTLAERYTGGAAAIRSAGGEVSNHPWVAVLDGSGKRLAASGIDGPATAAVAKPVNAVHLEQVLKGTARTLTADEIQAMVKSLWIP